MSAFCRQCSHVLAAGAAFCPSCGLPTGVNAANVAPQGRSVRDFGGRGGQGFSGNAPRPDMRYTSGPDPSMYIQDQRSTIDYLLMPWRRTFDFSGRSNRKEYWHFAVPVVLGYIALLIVLVVASQNTGNYISNAAEVTTGIAIMTVIGAWWLITLIPGIALAIRRLHDCDQSGWIFLGIFVVQILFAAFGGLALIVLGCIKGTIGPNKYGADPSGAGAGDIFR